MYAIVLAILLPAAALAQPSVASRAPDLDAWLAGVGAAERALQADCAARAAAGPPPNGRVWLRAGARGFALTADPDASPAALAWWLDATLGARAAAAALFGGDAAAFEGLMIEAQDGRLSVFDGVRMQRSELCGALARVTAAAAGLGATPAPFAQARAAVAAAVAAPVGGSAEVAIRGLDFSGAAVLRGPDGVAAEIGPVGADGAALAVVAPQAGARPGPGVLRVYAADDPFRPRAEFALRVLPGAPPPPAALSLAPGESAAGALAVGGEAVLTLDLAAGGDVSLRSTGPQDLRAQLETEAGEPLAQGDDTAAGYGFAIETRLPAGRYRLRVSHCCGGGGGFSVVAAPR